MNQFSSSLKDAPILAEIFRGHTLEGQPIVECIHHGLVCILDGDGNLVNSYGNSSTIVHLRSCLKPIQVLPLIEMNYFDQPDYPQADLALMMSSHAGLDIHTARVHQLLTNLNLDEHALRCGIHQPQDEKTRCDLIRAHESPSPLHNNCSGKHVAMLIASIKQGYDINSYEKIEHPLQQQIIELISTLADVNKKSIYFGIDGCSLPSFAIPLRGLALMYARLAFWQDTLPKDRPLWLQHAFKKIWQAAISFPEFIAGPQRFDTELIKAGNGEIFCKTGADGMQAIAIKPNKKYPKGLGIAIKISDGDARQIIRPLIIKQILLNLDLWPNEPKLDKFLPSFKNWRGQITGGALLHLPAR